MQAAMGSNRTLENPSARGSHLLHMFGNSRGKLQRQLRKGEFAMFKHMPVFESDFIQVTKRGQLISVHNDVQLVTVGITYSSSHLPLPDIMLLARPVESRGARVRTDRNRGRAARSAGSLELTRLLPLKFVKISIHSHEKKQLHLKLASGRSFYLQLYAPANSQEGLFAQWEELVYCFLRLPVRACSGVQAGLAGDTMDLPDWETEDQRSLAAMEVYGEGDRDDVSIRSLPMDAEVSGAAGDDVQPFVLISYCVLKDSD